MQQEKIRDFTGNIVHLIKRKVCFSYLLGVAKKRESARRRENRYCVKLLQAEVM